MNLNLTQNAIISVLHQEPWYRFLGNEKRTAERMHKLGYLKPFCPSASLIARSTGNTNERGGKRFQITKKGEKAYMLDNARFNILNQQWSRFITESGRPIGLVSLDVSEFNLRGYVGVWIARIKTPEAHRNKGYAKIAMDALLKACRFHGVDIYLTINAYGDMTFDELFAWYERLGFKQVPGKERGFMRYACSRLYRQAS